MRQCGHEGCVALKEACATFHSNMPWALPACLRARGLQPALCGEQALLSAWRPGKGPPSKRSGNEAAGSRRGLLELRPLGACAELGDKKRLAMYLERCGLSMWAPLTIFTPHDMSKYGDCDSRVLWFLKHARKERNEGVSVHLGAKTCQSAWLAVAQEEQDDYVAQREVPAVLLDEEDRKLTFRIYLLLVAQHKGSSAMALVRREFICRSHPAVYDASDPDSSRHVHSTLDVFKDVQGRSSKTFSQCAAVWPAMLSMFKACRVQNETQRDQVCLVPGLRFRRCFCRHASMCRRFWNLSWKVLQSPRMQAGMPFQTKNDPGHRCTNREARYPMCV